MVSLGSKRGALGGAPRGFGCGAPKQPVIGSEAWSQVAPQTRFQPSVVGSVSEQVDRGKPC